MSWNSVVDDGAPAPDAARPAPAPSVEAADPAVDPSPVAAPPSVPLTPPAPVAAAVPTEPEAREPIAFAPLTLTSLTGDVAAPPPQAASPAPASPLSALAGPAARQAATTTVADDAPPVVKLAPLVPIVPAIGDIEPAPASAPAPATAPATAPASAPTALAPTDERPTHGAVATPASNGSAESAAAPAEVFETPVISTELPQIVEATPVPDGTSVEALGVDLEGAQGHSGPSLPTAQQPERPQAAPLVTEVPAPSDSTATKQRRRTGRRGLKLGLTLVVLAGLIAAGVVYGRDYLVPSGWDSTTEPYAVAVEEGRSVDFVEPIELITEPTPVYTARMSSELTGDWSADQPMWRALGLLSGPTTEQSVATVLEGQQDAVYSTDDGQVYGDGAGAGPELDAQITEAMVAASLDQEFGWSVDQPNRTLDDAAQTLAEVRRESRRVQRSSPFAAEYDPAAPAAVFFVPPVLGYRAFAPAVFSEFVNPAPAVVLEGIGVGGPGPLATGTPVLAASAAMIGTDVVVTSPMALDRSFWYLALAGYLDTRTAYQASEAIVENSIVTAERAGGQCVYATFAGGDVAQTATLRSALEAWSATVPAEFTSSFSVLPDGALQLVSCDPGAGFESLSRLGVAHELMGWRMAELATIEVVTDGGGADAELAAAWAAVEASSVGVDLASLPPETTPADAAAAARDAVGAVLVPAG